MGNKGSGNSSASCVILALCLTLFALLALAAIVFKPSLIALLGVSVVAVAIVYMLRG